VVLLALDTSTYQAGVGVSVEGRVLQRTWYSRNNHGSEVLSAAESLLREAGSSLREVERVAVALGPGGFSALRVGIATAKGLALARDLPLAGISTYDIEAARWWPQEHPLAVVIDAGSSGVAWTLYEPALGARLPTADLRRGSGIATPEGLATALPGNAVFCGEAVGRLTEVVDRARLLVADGPSRRPADLVRLAEARFAAGDVDDPARLVPFYARQPSITRPRDTARQQGR
jgi:tRNA threonylcarbamoyladenosine biosynthesis protein TsaB